LAEYCKTVDSLITYAHSSDVTKNYFQLVNSNESIRTDSFKVFCLNTAHHILIKLPFYRMTPTMHGILAHSAYWIEQNNGQGLNKYSETALEASHKRTKRSRIFQCFQGSTKANLEQAMRIRMMESNLVIIKEIERTRNPRNSHLLDSTDPVIARLLDKGVRLTTESLGESDFPVDMEARLSFYG